MQLAPQPHLSGQSVTIGYGLTGIRQTLDAMRRLVRASRTDIALRQIATSIVFLAPERDQFAEADALFSWVRDHVRYVRDVHEVETLSTPSATAAQRLGDCDDQACLLAALLEAVGYPTRFVAAGYSEPGVLEHVYVQALINGDWVDMDPTEHHPMGWAPPDPVAMYVEKV